MVKAPSTLGTFLRSFRWGHVRQLDRVSRELLTRAWAAGAGLGDGPLTIDLDSTICETCLGGIPMEYAKTDPATGHHLYRCQAGGCHLKGKRQGVLYCDSEVWEDPAANIRLFGKIRRAGPEWKALYRKRYAIERVFKGMKESRRLERHCVRGLRQIGLHALMSTLAFQATALVWILAGQSEWMRWQVRKVA